jgi:spore coat polysaccharide biosynthesis protein SpsF (cytidylyltransferase family)
MKTKNIQDILFVVQARLASTRCPEKVIRPFAGTTITNIALNKFKRSKAPNENIYFSAYEEKLKNIGLSEGVKIFDRSKKSANWDGGKDLREIFEWWNVLPFKYVVTINACTPMLKVETINKFIDKYVNIENDAMFGVVRKKNYVWNTSGEILNSPEIIGGPDTKVVKPYYEAAHCLYAGSMEKIGQNIWMGDFTKPGDIELFEVPEEEIFDIRFI